MKERDILLTDRQKEKNSRSIDRGIRLKDFIYSHQHALCPERTEIITFAFQSTEGLPVGLRRAKAFESILAGMSIYISPDELIVGNQARKPRSAPIFPEFDVDWIDKEFEELPTRTSYPFQVDSATKKALRRVSRMFLGEVL